MSLVLVPYCVCIDSCTGMIPVAGDIANASLNHILIVRKARQTDISSCLLRQMLLNNAISTVAGIVPVVGNLVTAAFKANSRNARLLEGHLRPEGLSDGTFTNERKPSTSPFDGLSESVKVDRAVQVDEEDVRGMENGLLDVDRIQIVAKRIYHHASQTWASQSQYKHE
jgi:hypothetical protein